MVGGGIIGITGRRSSDDDDHQPPGAGKPAADDVAADMEHRLEQLGEDVHDAERKAAALPENPLKRRRGRPGGDRGGPALGRRAPWPPREHRRADDEAAAALGPGAR